MRDATTAARLALEAFQRWQVGSGFDNPQLDRLVRRMDELRVALGLPEPDWDRLEDEVAGL